MKATTAMVLTDNLKALNLSHMLRTRVANMPMIQTKPMTCSWIMSMFIIWLASK
jgi:hypothetical protein